MKVFATINAIEHFDNRSNINFNIGGNHTDYVTLHNKVTSIASKYNAQTNIYSNKSSLVFDNKANVIGLTDGNSGGTITFHSHSCSPKDAVLELENLLKSANEDK